MLVTELKKIALKEAETLKDNYSSLKGSDFRMLADLIRSEMRKMK